MAGHSEYGGASLKRGILCPGSVALLRTVPTQPSTIYADEGTLAHEWAAWALTEGERDLLQHVGMTLDAAVDAVKLTEEMARGVQLYIDAVWKEFDLTKDARIYVETSFNIDVEAAEPGEVHGRNDCIIYHPSTGRVRTFDLKYGAGQRVDVEDNEQAKFYSTGA